MSNQDAFEADSDERLTVEGVMEQIAAKVAELCGHDEGGLEEPLSSFGLNSISVAELGAFIQSEFNFQASALELMTTASCQSLAYAIVFGTNVDEDAEAEDESASTDDAPLAAPARSPHAFGIRQPARGPLPSGALFPRQRRAVPVGPVARFRYRGTGFLSALRISGKDRMTETRLADQPVPRLAGRLPPQCRRDLDELRRVVHSAGLAGDAGGGPSRRPTFERFC